MFHSISFFIYVFVLVLITVYVSSHINAMLLISCHDIYIFLSFILCFMPANTLEVDKEKKLYVPEGTITVRAGTKKSPKSADFSEKYRISVGLEKILGGKNRMEKNRDKSAIFRRFFGKGPIFADFSGRAIHARRRRVRADIIADKSAINSKYRRFSAFFRGFFLNVAGPWIFFSF